MLDEGRRSRQLPLVTKETRGLAWTLAECEQAVQDGLVTKAQADAYYAFLKATQAAGFELVSRGGIEVLGLSLAHCPRQDGGYRVPTLLRGLTYRGESVDFLDPTAPEGRQWAQVGGEHRETGAIVLWTQSLGSGGWNPPATYKLTWVR